MLIHVQSASGQGMLTSFAAPEAPGVGDTLEILVNARAELFTVVGRRWVVTQEGELGAPLGTLTMCTLSVLPKW